MLGKGGPVGLRRKYLKSSVMFDYQIPAHKQKGKNLRKEKNHIEKILFTNCTFSVN